MNKNLVSQSLAWVLGKDCRKFGLINARTPNLFTTLMTGSSQEANDLTVYLQPWQSLTVDVLRVWVVCRLGGPDPLEKVLIYVRPEELIMESENKRVL